MATADMAPGRVINLGFVGGWAWEAGWVEGVGVRVTVLVKRCTAADAASVLCLQVAPPCYTSTRLMLSMLATGVCVGDGEGRVWGGEGQGSWREGRGRQRGFMPGFDYFVLGLHI